MSESTVITGTVIRVIYSDVSKPLSPFSICQVAVSDSSFFLEDKLIILKLYAEVPEEGILYKFYGEMDRDNRGDFFKCSAYIREIPIDLNGVIDFLGSGLFYGIKRKKAELIVKELGEDCLVKIITNPEILKNVKGISDKTIDSIAEKLLENLGMQELISKLHHFRISLKLAKKIYKYYGHSSVKMIEDNPYCLANNVRGISFNKADEIANELKIIGADPIRIKGAIEYVLYMIYEEDGSTYALKSYVISKVRQLLFTQDQIDYSDEVIIANLKELVFKDVRDIPDFKTDIGQVRQVDNRIYLARYYGYEKNIASALIKLNANKIELDDFEELVDIYLRASHDYQYKLSDEQERAVFNSLENRVSIITGGPGTGKSTVILMILMVYTQYKLYNFEDVLDRIILLAPTGRAAKRMYEITKVEAFTIHSFLERRDEKEIDNRLFIIDEASMLDITIMNKFVAQLKQNDQVILVGDDEQLPPIKAGNFFIDIINAGIFPIVELKEVFRQKESSGILKLAKYIRSNQWLDDKLVGLNDLNWIKAQRNEIVASIYKEVCRLISLGEKLGDIQIIAPINNGEQGVININQFIQSQLLEGNIRREFEMTDTGFYNHNYRFYTGDKVIQLVNNTSKSIVNGDIGYIVGVLSAEGQLDSVSGIDEESELLEVEQLIVNFDGRDVLYRKEDLQELALAYCFTVHKSQGSEFPNVILPISRNYLMLMNKNLLYTAITRASKTLCILGDLEFFEQGLKISPNRRYTFLSELLNIELTVENSQ